MDLILLQKPLQTQTPVNSQSVNTAVWEMFLLSLVWSDISCFSLTFLLVERCWLPSPEKRFGSCGTSPGHYEPQLDVCPVFSTAVLIGHMIAASDRLHDVEAKQTVTLLINKELWFIHFTVRRAWWKQKKNSAVTVVTGCLERHVYQSLGSYFIKRSDMVKAFSVL